MKKLLILSAISLILPLFLSACDKDDFCYREGIYIFDAENQEVLHCQEGSWHFESLADVPLACNFVCTDKESERANHEWCQEACTNFIDSTNY